MIVPILIFGDKIYSLKAGQDQMASSWYVYR